MFGWFKRDPVAEARKAYEARLTDAMNAQRQGDVVRAAAMHADAAVLLERLEAAEAAEANRR